MKNPLTLLFVCLVSFYIVFTFLGRNSDYAAEKSFWKINKDYERIMREPALVPEITFDELVSEYEKFSVKFPHSHLTPLAQVYIGNVDLSKKDYESARNVFEKIVINYPENKVIGVQAVAGIGSSYALQEDYDNAIRTYDRIIKEYPLSELGFKAPLLKLRYYYKQNKREAGEQAFRDALSYYDVLITENKGKAVEYRALKMKAALYLEMEMPRDAVNILGEIMTGFSLPGQLSAQQIGNLIKSINTISLVQLKDVDLPIGIYSQFVQAHPENPHAELLKRLVENLRSLKGPSAGGE
jgi:tetratricopeptide (TPR) repeat protein